MADSISNRADMLDVRDIIERYEELEGDKDLATDNAGTEEEAVDGTLFNEDDSDEFSRLGNLLLELKDNGGDEQWRGDWYPVTLIHRDYFVNYAREVAEDSGARINDWPLTCIDWTVAADELEQDYSTVDFDGEEYLYR